MEFVSEDDIDAGGIAIIAGIVVVIIVLAYCFIAGC